ncbi:phosphonate ABC transporter ATP-binding protein [Weissella halotolerans]|uniref:ABC-type phosphate phosphonate transport system ATPase component n=1 Tax=Weissella halotolerans DSM 20190 TaxID=1123500 RepID=A0A0R2FZ05_9LACO|nr:phosphonate ABC transporter ATP-binding protein [Weissella halotolerans]KRN30492.1 ABC-type phosphate phosphonate transport system ATPase component [Weissella halotolerans DSM 20190]
MVDQKGTVQIQHISKVYPNGTVGLDDIDLTINAGEFVVVVGLSGAGKSTLMRAINRLHDISDGAILIDGEDITQAKGKALRRLRRNLAMIFQNFNLVKRTTVMRNVLSGRVGYYSTFKSTLGLFSKADRQQALANLERVNMADKAYIRADELSGGQQQRVAIARAMMQSPTVFLADEPIASLDPKTTKMVMDDLKRLNEELGMTVIVNLHSVPLALEYASRVIGLQAGKLVYDKQIADVNQTDFAAIYAEAGDKE